MTSTMSLPAASASPPGPPRTVWQALTSHPWRFLRSSWPWRAVAYLASGAVFGIALAGVLFAWALVSAIGSVFLIGLVGIAALALVGLLVAPVERWRLRLVDRETTASPHRTPLRPGFRAWLATRYREQATWRELAAALLTAILGFADALILTFGAIIPGLLISAPILFLIDAADHNPDFNIQLGPGWVVNTLPRTLSLVPIGLVLLVVAFYAWTLWAAARAALTRYLLAPREAELGERVVALTKSRARLVDAFEVERRRIERDLHDGAQQRLVALTVELGLAKLDLPPDSPATSRVTQAHDQAKLALGELRELIRGVHPQVLTDRGLAPALADVAGRSPVPVAVDVEVPGRLPGEIEAAAYFVATEALANVAQHSQASAAVVYGRLVGKQLIVEITDDGVGGANPAAGTGLLGLADRVSVVNGVLTLHSPVGGPTKLRVEIPCS